MIKKKYVAIILYVHLIVCAADAQNFIPYSESYMRLIQSISFSPDGKRVYFTLPHKEYLNGTGLPISNETPRLAIYQAEEINGTWGAPEMLPFCGKFTEYEPSLSPDGNILFFNSNKSIAPGKVSQKNNIWYSIRENGAWQEPQYLYELNTEEFEESYATIDNSGNLYYVAEHLVGGKSEYAIYQTSFTNSTTKPGVKIGIIDHSKGSSDPWVSPEGNYLIFTMYDENNWQGTCDLFISVKVNDSWQKAIELKELNSDGPDYAVAISPDQKWIYYRKSYQFVRLPFELIITKYIN